ncbi:hypothetical protein L1049_008606 [Liquidambar formosana]|uniref:UMP kinase n=1 Tax=Liquidambar formosana TaxID=63359 RepID=A0AAP0S398_LIQFO
MASCDDDFALLGDDNHHQTNPNHHHHHLHHHTTPHHHHHQPYAPHRFATKATPIHAPPPPPSQPILPPSSVAGGGGGSPKSGGDDEDEGDDYNDAPFCSQADSKCPSTFHDVHPFSAEDEANAFADESDPNKARVSVRSDKRKDREELSDGGTPYCYKKSKLAGSGGAGSGGAGTSGGDYRGDYRKDREEWSDTAISCLLDAYTEKFTQLNRGNLRGRDWEEVASIVSERCDKQTKSVEQCKNKKMEQIVGNSLPMKNVSDEDKSIGGSANTPRQSKRYAITTPSPVGQINNVKSKSMSNPRWRRVVFKISGAALAGTGPNNIDPKVAMLIAREVAIASRFGVEVAIVVGGRNFFCGDTWVTATGLDRCTAYQIGMMATVMNSILLQSALEKMGVQTRVQTAFAMQEVAEPYSRQRAIRHLEKGRVVIFGGIGAGTGNPLFSTDTAAALRASEIHAEAVLKGTNVDGVYDSNSRNNNVTFEHISLGRWSPEVLPPWM